MSKDLILTGKNADLPEHLKHLQGAAADSNSLVSGFDSAPSLSVRGKQFRFQNGDDERVLPAGATVEVILLAADPEDKLAKAYYAKAWSPDSNEAPDCFSSDGERADPFVEAPIHQGCAGCPMNQFGTGKNPDGSPGKGKACSDHKKLFLVEANNPKGDIYVLRVPATSLKALSGYGRKLSRQGVTFKVVSTEISFVDAVHPQLDFNATGWISEEALKIIEARMESGELEALLPSKNVMHVDKKIEVVEEQAALPPPPKAELPPPPKAEPVKTMTAAANGITLQQYLDSGWTEQQLIDAGYMEIK
jgi:hypothetical protein